MLLHRYFGSHAEDTIQSGMLKVSKPSDFNDPFEFMHSPSTEPITKEQAIRVIYDNLSDAEFREQIKKEKGLTTDREFVVFIDQCMPTMIADIIGGRSELDADFLKGVHRRADKNVRIVSFNGETESSTQILMWSHYSNHHKGVRIAFDLPISTSTFLIEPVDYRESRVMLNGMDVGLPTFEKALRDSMKTKSKVWGYENEYRMFISPSDVTTRNGMDFIPFDRAWVKRIDLGLRYPNDERRADFLKIIELHCPKSEVYSSSIPLHGYQLNHERIQ